jgi:hypothetical protein
MLDMDREQGRSRPKKRVALINGGRMQKSLYVARALHEIGYRVILVEEKGWGEVCATRFSKSVESFHLVPAGGGKPYIDAMVDILIKKEVNVFIPCSGAGTTVEDAKVAELIRSASEGKVMTLIQDVDLVKTLHEKVCL